VINKLILLFSLLTLSLVLGCSSPQPTGKASDPIDISQDPSQVRPRTQEPIVIASRDGEFTLMPVAGYKISALVASKKSYRLGWEAGIAPLDLALVWGKLAEPEYDKYITYLQNNRWYFFHYKAGSPFDKQFVIAHSSNHHIIPATENVRQALQALDKKEKVVLEGFLVNLTGQYRRRDVWWKSSLSRTDTGNGACELFYVKKARIGNEIFE
jgi:hypothetical protein